MGTLESNRAAGLSRLDATLEDARLSITTAQKLLAQSYVDEGVEQIGQAIDLLRIAQADARAVRKPGLADLRSKTRSAAEGSNHDSLSDSNGIIIGGGTLLTTARFHLLDEGDPLRELPLDLSKERITIGDVIKAYRCKAKMTLRDVDRMTEGKVAPSTLSRIEGDQSSMSVGARTNWSRALDLHPCEIALQRLRFLLADKFGIRESVEKCGAFIRQLRRMYAKGDMTRFL